MKMRISPLTKAKLLQVLTILAFWMFIGVLMSFHEAIIFDFEADQYVLNIQEDNVFSHLLFSLLGPFLGGVIGAGIIVFWAIDRFQKFSYGKMILSHSVLYIVIIFVLSIVIGLIYSSMYLEKNIVHPTVFQRVVEFVLSIGLVKVVISWYLITLATIFLIQVDNKYGPGNLRRMILGKYHQARTEERIFMFLDLKSSTSIAEQLGHKRYFNLLQELYRLITSDILNHRGEVYQYVGDEIVLTWKYEKGLRKSRCLNCFFAIQERLGRHDRSFVKKFSIQPQFKAGMHLGKVTVGEIGVIKKDIVFTGDVLNTTARIMEQCNVQHEELIISSDLASMIDGTGPQYFFKDLGSIQLKGKTRVVDLFAVRKHNMA